MSTGTSTWYNASSTTPVSAYSTFSGITKNYNKDSGIFTCSANITTVVRRASQTETPSANIVCDVYLI